MAKLHELLAVEGDKQAIAKAVVEEAKVTFTKKPELFHGAQKRYQSFIADENVDGFEETASLTTTVKDKLAYVFNAVGNALDVSLAKEATNQTATADLIVDGVTLGTKLPVTFLLGLESRLKELREMFLTVPTLSNGIEWVEDAQKGENVFRMKEPEKKFRTHKTFRHKVLYEATDKHPAQIEKWEETENIGLYIIDHWSGMISSAQKAMLLTRLDKLIHETKRARQRANSVDVVERTIGAEIENFLLV
jgi:hypothetical protein